MDPDPRETYDRPLDIAIHGDEVVITGPGPTGIALTASAAAQSADRLAEAARLAFGAAAQARSTRLKAP